MNRIINILTELNDLTTDIQVIDYWESQQNRILENLKTVDSDFETATKIIHRLAKSLNEREKYSSVYYLYKTGFLPIESKVTNISGINEVRYELGRGLHHNRKYDHSKRLFNELASTDFDTNRIEGWWNQSVFASTRERVWIKTDFLSVIGSFAIMATYIMIVLKTKEFLISTTVFIIIFELFESWWYQYRVSSYLKEFDGTFELIEIKKKIRNMILIELGISLLFYPIYLLKQDLILPIVFVIVVYFQTFHIGLNYYYLPKLIGELNKTKSTTR